MPLQNQIYIGSHQRQSVYDLNIPEPFNQTIILFIHGYKGYKDWGAWQLMENVFADSGYGFCKFNLSHNGGTVEQPVDFPDLEAFSENRYSYEVNDVNSMIDLLHKKFPNCKIVLMGHSRGGGNAILCSSHPAVDGVITLAAISSVKYRFRHSEVMEQWKKDGVRYETNSRTQQEMPLKYIQYLDFLENEKLLDIEAYARKLNKPCLHFHGSHDESINIEEGIALASWTKAALYVLENSGHTFESAHPWQKEALPVAMQFIVNKSISFLDSL